jgi:succinate dehydrogenase / fumarate reductase cytochrome b subunit
MVVLGFSEWPVAASYMLANVLLGFHLSHGIASAFQTLGAAEHWEAPVRRAAQIVAVTIAAGNASIPLAVLLKLVPPGGG